MRHDRWAVLDFAGPIPGTRS